MWHNKLQVGDRVRAWNHLSNQRISGKISNIDQSKPFGGITVKLDDDEGEFFIPMESIHLWIFEMDKSQLEDDFL